MGRQDHHPAWTVRLVPFFGFLLFCAESLTTIRYILSLLVPRHMVSGDFTGIYGCDTASLRTTNALALTALAYLAMVARRRIEAILYKAHSGTAPGVATRYAAHTALNVALCPILFFFSGLYYTDVASTAVVLACLVNSLGRLSKERPSIMDDLATVALGLLALFMRQTNVFWVVVFLGSLEGIHAVKTLRPARVDQPVMNTLSERVKFFASRYSLGDVHDPPLRMSWPDGKSSVLVLYAISVWFR
jgi:alpha-1,2-glucosyltransferase